MTGGDRLILFLRTHNDIDYLSSVVYKWATTDESPVDVVIASPEHRLSDYRVAFLDTLPSVNIHHVTDFQADTDQTDSRSVASSLEARVLSGLQSAGTVASTVLPNRISVDTIGSAVLPERTYQQLQTQKVPKIDDEDRILDSLVVESETAVVAFDWETVPSNGYFRFMSAVVSAARARGFRTVSLPHGGGMFRNAVVVRNKLRDLLAEEAFTEFGRDLSASANSAWENLTHFDDVVIPNEMTFDRVSGTLPTAKIHTLGMPRYDPEWLDVLEDICPPQSGLPQSDDTNVVFFMSPEKSFLNPTDVKLTFDLLGQLPDTNVLVQDHPREELARTLLADSQSEPPVTVVSGDIESAALAMWGDVFLHLGSSIVFHPLVRGKPCLELRYLHGYQTVFAEYLDEWTVDSIDELYYLLETLVRSDDDSTYPTDSRQRLIDHQIHPGDGQSSLDRYVQLLQSDGDRDSNTE